MTVIAKSLSPSPMLYHRAMVEHLQVGEPGLWNWFASTRKRGGEAEAVRLDLLKTNYRLEPALQSRLYELANDLRQGMGLDCQLTLYQAQTGNTLNAALAYLPGEAHLILAGPLTSVLAEVEVRAVLAHELGHFLLLEHSAGEYLIAADLLRALSTDPAAGPAAAESARLYSLWTEIFADRWACRMTQDFRATIAALIKIETGLSEVSAESYLRQADEVFSKSKTSADHFSHPEPYIRARALRLWAEQGEEAHTEISRMIEGDLNLHRLDLLAQKRVANLTRRFFGLLLKPRWFQTEPVLAHARQFFADFVVDPDTPEDTTLKTDVECADSSLQDYLCYLMLDFVTVDRDLANLALSAAIVLGRRLDIDKRLAELAQNELALGKKAFAKIARDAESILARAETTPLAP
jgi:Zn-dependent protease with chaperone function